MTEVSSHEGLSTTACNGHALGIAGKCAQSLGMQATCACCIRLGLAAVGSGSHQDRAIRCLGSQGGKACNCDRLQIAQAMVGLRTKYDAETKTGRCHGTSKVRKQGSPGKEPQSEHMGAPQAQCKHRGGEDLLNQHKSNKIKEGRKKPKKKYHKIFKPPQTPPGSEFTWQRATERARERTAGPAQASGPRTPPPAGT